MDQATTGGLLHFHLTMFEDDESSTSAMRSDVLVVCVRAFKSTPRSAWKMGLDIRYVEVCVRAFKSTPRSAWKMGLDIRYVDRGIKIFQFYFRSSLQMEWLPSFCFICGVLGSGGFLRFGSHVLSDWRKGVFEKLCVAWRGGSEDERREEDTGFQIPVVVNPVSLGTEKGSCSTVSAVVCSLSPAPSFVEHSRVSQWSSEAKNRFWAFKCFLLWPKDLPARKPQVISFLLMSPPLEPKKRDSKMLTCKLRNIAGLSGSLRGVVCNCL